jgi:hypothetical protein
VVHFSTVNLVHNSNVTYTGYSDRRIFAGKKNIELHYQTGKGLIETSVFCYYTKIAAKHSGYRDSKRNDDYD